MPQITRIVLMMTFVAALATAVFAQEATTSSTSTDTTTSTGTTATTTTAKTTSVEEASPAQSEGPNSHDTRNEFLNLLTQHPPELGTILALDPTLLSNEAFLAGYPEVARFVAAHPEVRRNPRFFLDRYRENRTSQVEDILNGLFILTILSFFAFVLSWVLRTVIEQRRWNRLSRTQSEVHNKILDRFGTSSELLEYMKTPAGTKFLESAPISVREAPTQNAPLSRVMWSIQLGIVVAAASVGLLLVSSRFDKESAQGLFAMGVIALCIGAGFIASAFVSVMVSRRLGAWQGPDSDALSDSGPVR